MKHHVLCSQVWNILFLLLCGMYFFSLHFFVEFIPSKNFAFSVAFAHAINIQVTFMKLLCHSTLRNDLGMQ